MLCISIHAPLTGSDRFGPIKLAAQHNFNPRSPYGERLSIFTPPNLAGDFNPRSPYGERRPPTMRSLRSADFNPRSPYGERRTEPLGDDLPVDISIHAPLTGSDLCSAPCLLVRKYFNPRSPYGERPPLSWSNWGQSPFQSTLPLRGATTSGTLPREPGIFQSTLPLRGATCKAALGYWPLWISIHAPLTGSDRGEREKMTNSKNFNPRSPYGERPIFPMTFEELSGFQSTLPLRGATLAHRWSSSWKRFQSTLPLRGATCCTFHVRGCSPISIHAPLTGSDM